MYPVSANFHTLAIADSPKTRCRIYFITDAVNCWDDADVQNNGTLLVGAAGDTDSNGRIGQGGVTVTEIFNKDKNLTIGGTVSYQIGMTLVNSDGALNNFAFGRCKVYLDVYDDVNSTWLPCPLGVFRIELPVKRKVQLISCTGYDQMQVLNAIADTWWNGLNFTGGLTIANILNSMVTQLGLHLSATSSTSMVNTALSFTTPPIDSVERTYRDILGWIAEATGTVAHFNRDGELDMRQYLTPQIGGNNIVIDTDTTRNQCLSIDVAEYSVSKIDALTIKLTTADQGVTVGSGTNVYTIMDNPFLYGPDVATIQGKLTPIYNRLSAYATYSPISTRLIYDWSVEAGDIINILNNSTTYNMPIFQQKMTWRGGYVTSELISSGDTVRPQVSSGERETYRYNVEMATKVGDNEIISKINQTAEQIQIQASKVNLTGYITATNLATAGQTVINGGNITTGELSADRISGGTLTVGGLNNASGRILIKDSNNDVVGSIDKDCYMLINPSNNSTAARFGMTQNDNDAYIHLYDSVDGKTVDIEATNGGSLNINSNNGSVSIFGKYGIIGLSDGTYTRVTMQGANGTILLQDANNVNQVLLNPQSSGSQFLVPLYTSGGLTANNGLTADNATVTGVLDVTQRRCYATLTGANTWYRVLTFNADSANQAAGYAGCVIDLNIGRKGADNETHSIQLEIVSANVAFSGEKSVSVNKYIDKIRYWRNDNIGYIDIHTLSSNLIVWVDFNVHDAYSSQQNYSANSLETVSAAPAGSLVAEYTFSSNAYHKPVAAEGVSNGWSYVLYADNTIDAIRTITDTQTYYSTVNGFYGYYIANIDLPFTMADTNYYIGTAWSIGSGFSVPAGLLSVTTTKFNAYGFGTYGASNASVKLTMHLKGKIA